MKMHTDVSRLPLTKPPMSLRDWYAGQAIAGMLASELDEGEIYSPAEIAARAYAIADEMLARGRRQ